MSRLLFGRGAKGALVTELQTGLLHRGFDPQGADGVFGNDTVNAVREFQKAAGAPITGSVSDDEWQTVTGRAVPSVESRCLQLTSAFEGHGFTLVQGNWDGAWLTWGIIGFTLKHGEIQRIIRAIQQRAPQRIDQAFGSDAAQLLQVIDDTGQAQEAFANSISQGARVVEPWHSAFQRFGSFPEVQAEQSARAHDAYFVPAQETATELNLTTERGIALCFDVQVQNGGVRQNVKDALAAMATAPELDRLEALASGVANNATPQFRADVLSRKMAIAQGEGTVHGAGVLLVNWGIALVPAS
jgi:hypothetical protein